MTRHAPDPRYAPPKRTPDLKELSPAYAIAAEAYQLAVGHDASSALQVALFEIVRREERKALEGRKS